MAAMTMPITAAMMICSQCVWSQSVVATTKLWTCCCIDSAGLTGAGVVVAGAAALLANMALSSGCLARRRGFGFEEGDQAALDARQVFHGAGQLQPRAECRLAALALGKVDQTGVDVGLARDRRGVAERGGDWLEHRLEADVALRGGERLEGEHARAPGAEVLGGKV